MASEFSERKGPSESGSPGSGDPLRPGGKLGGLFSDHGGALFAGEVFASKEARGFRDRGHNAGRFGVPELVAGSDFDLVIGNSRGVQIGNDNLQLNSYVCTIKPSVSDPREVFELPAVRTALAEVMRAPDDARAQQRANYILGHLSHIPQPAANAENVGYQSYSGPRGILGFLFVTKSEGVQWSDHARQENTFTYILSPDIETAQLLHDDKGLRQEVIAGVRSKALGGVKDNSLSESMRQALFRAAAALDFGDISGSVVHPFAGEGYMIADVDGVSIGWDIEQRNKIDKPVEISGAGSASYLDELSALQARIDSILDKDPLVTRPQTLAPDVNSKGGPPRDPILPPTDWQSIITKDEPADKDVGIARFEGEVPEDQLTPEEDDWRFSGKDVFRPQKPAEIKYSPLEEI